MLKKLNNKRGEMIVAAAIVGSLIIGLTARAGLKGFLKNPAPESDRNNSSGWYKDIKY